MEQRNELLLQLDVKVDQQVTAAQDIELAERRIGNDVLLGEDDAVAQFLADAVALLVGHEIALQPLRRHVGLDAAPEITLAPAVDRVRIEVGGEDLQRVAGRGRQPLHHFGKHDGQRVRLLARGAGRHPRLQRQSLGMGRQQFRQRRLGQVIPHLGVAEELGHPDQQFLEQQFHFLRIVVQVVDILLHAAELAQLHAALDAAQDGIELVVGKIGAHLLLQQLVQLVHGVALAGADGVEHERGAAPVGQDQGRHVARQRHDVGRAGVDGALRHGIEPGRRRRLHQRQAALHLDGLQAARAVAAHARQDDADGAVAAAVGQRGEKGIDRQALAARGGRRHQGQRVAGQAQVAVGRYHVDAIGFDHHAVRDLAHLHRRHALQQLGQHALVFGIQVLDDDVGQAAVGRHAGQEIADRFQPAGRGTYGHHRHGIVRRGGAGWGGRWRGGVLGHRGMR